MKYLMDTDICVFLMNGDENVKRQFSYKRNDGIAISAVTLSELEFGVFNSKLPEKNKNKLNAFLIMVNIIPYGDEDAVEYGRLRATLTRSGNLIGPMDMLIAAQALARGLTLVTNNTREFGRVNGLVMERWRE